MKRRTASSMGLAAVIGLALVLSPSPGTAQDAAVAPATLDASEREAVVMRIRDLLEQRYVFPEIGEASGADLLARLRAGEFDDVREHSAFAALLTEALQGVTNDKHLRVRVRPPARAVVEREDPARAQAQQAARDRARNYGFQRVELLEDNVGYVDMRYFDGSAEAKRTASAAMNFVANADAVIFDMRKNGGGSPDMVRYVSSWFFGEPTHLNSLYFRAGDRTVEFWTLDEIPGTKRPNVPLFVLTSSRTFSGAEEFSYNMRTQERATLIGEVTGGGANPGGTAPINERFEIFIPSGAAINPITGTNWEGVGVTPHIEVSADEAFDVALENARAAAKAFGDSRGLEIPVFLDEPLTVDALAVYKGVYELAAGIEVAVSVRDGQLFAKATGQEEGRLMAQGDHTFVAAEDTSIRVVFSVEGSQADGLVLNMGGMAMAGRRVR